MTFIYDPNSSPFLECEEGLTSTSTAFSSRRCLIPSSFSSWDETYISVSVAPVPPLFLEIRSADLHLTCGRKGFGWEDCHSVVDALFISWRVPPISYRTFSEFISLLSLYDISISFLLPASPFLFLQRDRFPLTPLFRSSVEADLFLLFPFSPGAPPFSLRKRLHEFPFCFLERLVELRLRRSHPGPGYPSPPRCPLSSSSGFSYSL